MATLYDLGQRILRIREAVNEIGVKGSHDAGLVVYVDRQCGEIIQLINDAAREGEQLHESDSDLSEQN